ncbi:MAG: metalloprotease TldD, partial [Roseibium sp.]|nr:metalloprotease TldD [Roseibium sp.]
MTISTTDLIETSGLGLETAKRITEDALSGADDGELYVEYRQTEGLVFDNGRLKAANYDTAQGFGLRAVAGEAAGYAHAGEISEGALKRAADAVSAVKKGYSGSYAAAPARTNLSLYSDANPLGGPSFEEKVKLLQEIDAY